MQWVSRGEGRRLAQRTGRSLLALEPLRSHGLFLLSSRFLSGNSSGLGRGAPGSVGRGRGRGGDALGTKHLGREEEEPSKLAINTLPRIGQDVSHGAVGDATKTPPNYRPAPSSASIISEQAYSRMISAYWQAGNLDAVQSTFQKAHTAGKQLDPAATSLAVLASAQKGNIDDAEASLEVLLRTGPPSSQVLNAMLEMYASSGDIDKMEAVAARLETAGSWSSDDGRFDDAAAVAEDSSHGLESDTEDSLDASFQLSEEERKAIRERVKKRNAISLSVAKPAEEYSAAAKPSNDGLSTIEPHPEPLPAATAEKSAVGNITSEELEKYILQSVSPSAKAFLRSSTPREAPRLSPKLAAGRGRPRPGLEPLAIGQDRPNTFPLDAVPKPQGSGPQESKSTQVPATAKPQGSDQTFLSNLLLGANNRYFEMWRKENKGEEKGSVSKDVSSTAPTGAGRGKAVAPPQQQRQPPKIVQAPSAASQVPPATSQVPSNASQVDSHSNANLVEHLENRGSIAFFDMWKQGTPESAPRQPSAPPAASSPRGAGRGTSPKGQGPQGTVSPLGRDPKEELVEEEARQETEWLKREMGALGDSRERQGDRGQQYPRAVKRPGRGLVPGREQEQEQEQSREQWRGARRQGRGVQGGGMEDRGARRERRPDGRAGDGFRDREGRMARAGVGGRGRVDSRAPPVAVYSQSEMEEMNEFARQLDVVEAVNRNMHDFFSRDFEGEYNMEVDSNPDIEEKGQPSLEEYLDSWKEEIMELDNVKGEEEWKTFKGILMQRAPALEALTELYVGPQQVTAMAAARHLDGIVAEKLPGNVSPEVRAFTERSLLTIKNNPNYSFKQKEHMVASIVNSLASH